MAIYQGSIDYELVRETEEGDANFELEIEYERDCSSDGDTIELISLKYMRINGFDITQKEEEKIIEYIFATDTED